MDSFPSCNHRQQQERKNMEKGATQLYSARVSWYVHMSIYLSITILIGRKKALNSHSLFSELDLCIYLMSSLGIKMEVEDGTSATCVELISTLIEEDELNLPRQAMDVFCLWMRSPLLEVQLKPHHKPFYIRRYVLHSEIDSVIIYHNI